MEGSQEGMQTLTNGLITRLGNESPKVNTMKTSYTIFYTFNNTVPRLRSLTDCGVARLIYLNLQTKG